MMKLQVIQFIKEGLVRDRRMEKESTPGEIISLNILGIFLMANLMDKAN